MPTFYYVVATYKDGRTEVFEGHYRDYKALTAELGSNPDVVGWTVDWES